MAVNSCSVGQLGKLFGVSIGTLHVYDKKGVLKAKRGGEWLPYYLHIELLTRFALLTKADLWVGPF